jgi:lysophospholipase L1-like esterase
MLKNVASGRRILERGQVVRSGRRVDYFTAAALAIIAAIASPPGVELITGRLGLSFRTIIVCLSIDAFLIVIIAAVLMQGRWRRFFFYVLAWTFPIALLAGLEAIAESTRLADVFAPLEDTSLLANKTPWPTYLLSESSYYMTPNGFLLYRPWSGNGVAFNALGLRTTMPTPKAPNEWRVAITGGSAVWGWRVFDADTIPVVLQDILRRTGHDNVTVYNFGIGGANLRQELELLKFFRDTYAIDQVLFYTGGNDSLASYIGTTNSRYGPWLGLTTSFELIKLMVRLQAMWSDPAPGILQWLDSEVLPTAMQNNTLSNNIAAAEKYCQSSNLRCDFVLQPMMVRRNAHWGSEAHMHKILSRVFPRIDVLTSSMYGDALASGPSGHIFDFSRIFDQTSQPLFLDDVHLNEAGNRIAAENLAPIIAARLP